MANEYFRKTTRVDEIVDEIYDINKAIEEIYSILGIPIVKADGKAVKDPCSGEYFPVHEEIKTYGLKIKTRVHFL